MENLNLYRHALPVIGNRGRGEVILVSEHEGKIFFNYEWDGKFAGVVEVSPSLPNTDVEDDTDYLIFRKEGTDWRDYDMIQHLPNGCHEDLARGCIRAFVKGIEHTLGGN